MTPHDAVADPSHEEDIQVSESFDLGAARETLRLLQFANDRWREVYAHLQDVRFEGENSRREVSLRVRGPAVETIMWARALDDWCRGLPDRTGRPTQPVLTGYQDRRVEEEGLLKGARYATNRSLHQLLALMVPWGTMRLPLNTRDIFGTFGGVRWLSESKLPPRSRENNGQQEIRKHYVAHLARNEVGATLDRLSRFFESVLAPEETGVLL
ncbi:hypothetical protein [Actinophytocola sediminis]